MLPLFVCSASFPISSSSTTRLVVGLRQKRKLLCRAGGHCDPEETRDDPGLLKAEEEFRKGSVKRALEVDPSFHHYIFIERDAEKCEELEALAKEFSKRDIKIICDDANTALLNWCRQLDTKKARAVVFLDPFGASVEWRPSRP